MQMLYHFNFGSPLLDSGASLVAPVKTVVPRDDVAARGVARWDSYDAPQAGLTEEVYFFELLPDKNGKTRLLLKNSHSLQGVSLVYDTKQLPCFTQWKNTRMVVDGYVTGLEPGTNFPNPRSYETQAGRVVRLPPGAKITFDVGLEMHPDANSIAVAEQAIAKLQESTTPKISDKPQPGWSPP